MQIPSIVKTPRIGFTPTSKGYFCVKAFEILMFYLCMLLSETLMLLRQLKNLVFILLLLGDKFFFFLVVFLYMYRATRFRFLGK